MTLALLFWILVLIWFCYGLWASWPPNRAAGSWVFVFLLLVILGWKVFGAAIKN